MNEENISFLHRFKNKKVILVFISVLVVLILASTVYLVLSKKSAKQFYLESEGRNFRQYAEQIKKAYKDFYTTQEPYMNSINKRRVEITADLESASDKPFGISNAKGIFDVIEKSKLVIDTKNNQKMKSSVTKASLLLDKSPLMDAEIFTKDRQLAFTVPVLTPDMYFTVNLDKLDDVYKRFNIPLRPKEFISSPDIASRIKFSDPELDNVIKDYGPFISGLIDEKDVKYGKNVVLKVGDRERRGREVTVTLGGEKTKSLLKALADKAASDDVLLKLTYGNFADVAHLFDEAGFFQLFDTLEKWGYLSLNENIKAPLDSLNVKKDMEEFKSTFKNAFSRMSYPEGLKMTVVVDKSGNILDRKLDIPGLQDDSGRKFSIDVHSGKNDTSIINFKNSFFNLGITKIGPEGEKLRQVYGISSHILLQPENGDEKGKIEFKYEKSRGESVEFAFGGKLDIDRSTDKLTLKKNNSIKYNFEILGDKPDIIDRVKGEVLMSTARNNKLKTRNTNTVVTVNVSMPSFDLKDTTLKISLAAEDKFEIEDFNLPDIQNARTVDLNNISDTELQKVEEEIMKSFGTFYFNNKSIIDAFMQ